MGPTFEEAFAEHYRAIHRYLRRRLGEEAAEELAADTFAQAFAGWARFDPERPVRPWLYGIAANLLRHHWRDEERKLRAYARTGVDPVAPGPDEGRADAQRRLAGALADLRPDERELLLLRAWAELTDAEIAAALGLPVGTVKSRLSRTRGRLRNRIEAVGQEQAR